MPLPPGSRIGPYEITAAIGGGGMGEVFRARDTKLGRDVAIKVLPATFAQDHERVARFKREAQLLASLNHPNIAAIYGLEEAEGAVALILELVEGEDLSQRLKRGAIPVDETIAIAKQIAEALEEAHERGIIHRDLKPANVKVTAAGKVKVLDFGLAKAFDTEAGTNSSSADVSHSPTMSRHATEAGMIMGTAAYMSPEQARGKTVDKRADIWSFGVVLFEMLTGERLFAGDTVSDTLASVLKDATRIGQESIGGAREVNDMEPDRRDARGASPHFIASDSGRCTIDVLAGSDEGVGNGLEEGADRSDRTAKPGVGLGRWSAHRPSLCSSNRISVSYPTSSVHFREPRVAAGLSWRQDPRVTAR